MARFWIQQTQKKVRTRVDVGYERVVTDENGNGPTWPAYEDPTLPLPYRQSENLESTDLIDVLFLLEEEEGDLAYLIQALKDWKIVRTAQSDQVSHDVQRTLSILKTLEKAQGQYEQLRAAASS